MSLISPGLGQGYRAYRLVGGAGERARARGFVNAAWYRTPLPRPVLKELTRRSDAAAIRDTLVWYCLILAAGTLAVLSLGTVWAIPAFFLYGTLYAGPADSRWHECGHGTAFRTAWLNDLVYQLASFQVMRRPTVWRWSHARHHSDTLITGRDPEIQVQVPLRPLAVLLDFIGLKLAPTEFVKSIVNACGRMIEEEQTFIPKSEWPRVIREARIWLATFAAAAGAAVVTGSWVPLFLVGLPSIYGGWLYNFYGLTQHACLPENVLDHRLNSRTVLRNPISRFLYWNMNYHIEHHMFPTVPYHALPRLHEAIKADCPPVYESLWAAYREIIPALWRQWRDPSYVVWRSFTPGTECAGVGRIDAKLG